MTFSRSNSNCVTRLNMNDTNLDKRKSTKLLGIWISDDLSWSRNCKEITIKAFSRLSMLTKLKYVGVSVEDLLDIYKLHIRSITEYCSVVFHSRLTKEESDKLERIQRVCLKIILGHMYIDYESALEMSGLETLKSRRVKRCLDFSLKCIEHPKNNRLFPLNTRTYGQDRNTKETFEVNWARTESYKNSTIPYCQRMLNDHFKK